MSSSHYVHQRRTMEMMEALTPPLGIASIDLHLGSFQMDAIVAGAFVLGHSVLGPCSDNVKLLPSPNAEYASGVLW